MYDGAFWTITSDGDIEYWFGPGHTGNEADNTQKVFFFPEDLNSYYFGPDAFNETGNYNIIMNPNKLTQIERGAS